MSSQKNPFTPVDRDLLRRCLANAPGSWNDFVDRFISLIYHAIQYTAHLRSARVGPEDLEDIAAEVMLQLVADNFRTLREFRGESSLATYLTVIARRICVQELARRAARAEAEAKKREVVERPRPASAAGLETLEEVHRLLRRLPAREREVVRMFYLEGRTYEEISTRLHLPVNSIGPVLARAKKKLSNGEVRQARKAPKPEARRPETPG